ncbi:hypothetical protein EYF80_005293 [Liparis tanakae]|uniref:Uncharacterized protein n=1 Tax=Liparis tanakae TaxID=230148 RepID=A0A4Z2J513_9TELE|nr:hypothetical protein EYF80_005293 [Liparis tanakae]
MRFPPQPLGAAAHVQTPDDGSSSPERLVVPPVGPLVPVCNRGPLLQPGGRAPPPPTEDRESGAPPPAGCRGTADLHTDGNAPESGWNTVIMSGAPDSDGSVWLHVNAHEARQPVRSNEFPARRSGSRGLISAELQAAGPDVLWELTGAERSLLTTVAPPEFTTRANRK